MTQKALQEYLEASTELCFLDADVSDEASWLLPWRHCRRLRAIRVVGGKKKVVRCRRLSFVRCMRSALVP